MGDIMRKVFIQCEFRDVLYRTGLIKSYSLWEPLKQSTFCLEQFLMKFSFYTTASLSKFGSVSVLLQVSGTDLISTYSFIYTSFQQGETYGWNEIKFVGYALTTHRMLFSTGVHQLFDTVDAICQIRNSELDEFCDFIDLTSLHL